VRVLWYFRDIKTIPTFLGFLKSSGGVKMTPMSFLLLSRASGADGATPPGFLFPVKEQVASLNFKEELYKLLFFCIIHIIKKNFIYENYYSHVWDEQ
jgi:hypothetical protein